MYRKLVTAFSLSIASFAGAQSYVHQVLVLNEGYYNWTDQQQVVPVTLGSYDPATGEYQTVATMEGSRFGSDVHVDGEFYYVAADSRLLKFNKNDHSLIDQVEIEGIRKIEVWNNMILITRGELGGLPHYFEVRDASDLELITAITPADGLPHSIEDVVVADGKAWLGVNNSFDWTNITGYVAVVDLSTFELLAPIDLGANGSNPEKLMASNGSIHVLNNTDFTSSSISEIDIESISLQQTLTIANNSGCGASALAAAQEKVYFMEYAVNTLARYDITTNTVIDTIGNGISAYGLADDHINDVMYVTTTDFLTGGTLHVMEYDGTITSEVAVGVSPGHLALDIRNSTGVIEDSQAGLIIAPNPATDLIRISGFGNGAFVLEITDALGRIVHSASGSGDRISLQVAHFLPGIYTMKVNGSNAGRFVKQ